MDSDAHGGLEVEDLGTVCRERVSGQKVFGLADVVGPYGALDEGVVIDGLVPGGGRVVADSERLTQRWSAAEQTSSMVVNYLPRLDRGRDGRNKSKASSLLSGSRAGEGEGGGGESEELHTWN